MKLITLYESILNEKWSNGIYLDDDQILGISAYPFGGSYRSYYNKKINKFIPVNQMNSYDINDFDCDKRDLDKARVCLIKQDLDYNSLEIIKIRAKV